MINIDIDDLIEKLQEIRSKYGNIPLYQWTTYDDAVDLYYYDNDLEVKKIYSECFQREYYDYELDDVVTEDVERFNVTEFGEKIKGNVKNIHKGLIL